MWEINNALQLRGFLYACLLGVLYCILYDVFRAGREGGHSSFFSVFMQDLSFWLICSVTCFCFLLSVTNGELRAYVFFGIALGFVLMRVTVSPLLFFCLCKTVRFLRFIRGRLQALAARIYGKTEAGLALLSCKGQKISKLIKKTLKKLLKKPKGMLYTKHECQNGRYE